MKPLRQATSSRQAIFRPWRCSMVCTNKVAAAPKTVGTGRRGRLLFALDATASRQPLWDRAARITAEMFLAAAKPGRSEERRGGKEGVSQCRLRGAPEP